MPSISVVDKLKGVCFQKRKYWIFDSRRERVLDIIDGRLYVSIEHFALLHDNASIHLICMHGLL